MSERLIVSTDRGLFCPAGDFHIDAWGAVERNVVSHAHADHARRGAAKYLTARDNVPLMRKRLGADISVDGLGWGEEVRMRDVSVTLHPAGHIRGSAQVRVERGGEVWVFTGDYKLQADPTCDPFELVPCHTLITECTFGLPLFRWHEPAEVFAAINNWWLKNAAEGRTSMILAYSLGKAERVLAELDPSIGPILLHGAVLEIAEIYRAGGVELPPAMHASAENAKAHKGRAVVIAPPGALNSPWARKFDPVSVGVASGWMQVRGFRRRQAADRGFVLSDHLDWPGLMETISATGAQRVIATHGYTGPVVRYLREKGMEAEEFATRFKGEGDDEEVPAAIPATVPAEPVGEGGSEMERFTQLFLELDQSTRTTEKVEALKVYFREAPPQDSVWALYLLTGRKLGRTVSSTQLKEWAVEATGFPAWLVAECNLVAGDFSETLSLLLPAPREGTAAEPLHQIIERDLQALPLAPVAKQGEVMREIWSRLTSDERFVLHKLMGGNFRVGVSELLVIRALAEVVGIPAAAMTHRLAGKWRPTEAVMRGFLSPEAADTAPDPSLPYPFMLAHALNDSLETLGEPAGWLMECKWDGIRAQIIRRRGQTHVWSRGDQPVAEAFPEVIHAADALPDGTVLDGEIVAWNVAEARPLPFAQLQTRINRKRVEMSFWPDVEVRFLAFDVLEFEGRDVRPDPLAARREMLLRLVDNQSSGNLRASLPLECGTWEALRLWLKAAREAGMEGVMLKRLDSAYVPGRPTGPWWKLKVQPFSVDAVLIAAQPGRGRRAGLLTDYTFGVWDDGKLVPIAKAYSGLTDAELVEMDRYIRQNSRERFGPVYAVPPERVFELGFEQIQKSTRHKSGIAVRFPRILRIRSDKKAAEADTLASLRGLLETREKLG